MQGPIDEDAPQVADVAAGAVKVLSDATDASVGFPGLDSVRDLEAVLAALARLAEELQETAGHLDHYLTDQLNRDGLTTDSASPSPRVAGHAAGDALLEVQRLASRLSTAITAAEVATLPLRPR